jgi:hypothetical protein
MNTTEDRLKDSFDAIGGMVTAADVPALEFPGRRTAPRWLVPATAAAAAAVVVVGGTVALQGHSSHKTVAPSAVPTLPPAAAPPKFYLATVVPNPIAVYDTATGRKTSTTHIGGVTKVAATGDGRTFFAVSDGGGGGTGETFYRITIDGTGKITASTQLAIKLPHTDASVDALAVSRDGTKLAFAVQRATAHADPFSATSDVVVADVRTGRTTTWSSPRFGIIMSLSMNAGGRLLAFNRNPGMGPNEAQVRELDLTLPGRDLTASRVLVNSTRSATLTGPVTLSPDGRYLASAVEVPTAMATSNVVEYSTSSGRRIGTVLKGVYGHSEYGTITFDPTGSNLLIWGGGHRIGYVPNGKPATTLGAPSDIDYESTAAW